ncbi:60S ribosomal protein L14 [Reticulomyxa filosa]|uniref:60S ribosomal protein L14 n=1 Tax=Reticulomyxa filosa TaxID=46433 RepID=X6NWM2_RETFI|nr:60S ribosomal protein L14 [Reticulomyxa filosa]|eukprot:ETO30720.1 60S ribosomal protein L14 [Reticulomyxa filosa]
MMVPQTTTKKNQPFCVLCSCFVVFFQITDLKYYHKFCTFVMELLSILCIHLLHFFFTITAELDPCNILQRAKSIVSLPGNNLFSSNVKEKLHRDKYEKTKVRGKLRTVEFLFRTTDIDNKNLIVDKKNERYIQAGRICLIVYGTDYQKLVCIVDFIDRNRVLVDGAKGKLSSVKRSSYPIRRLQATKYRLPVARDVSPEALVKAVEDSKIKEIWESSATGRRHLCMRRVEQLNDFGRFKLYFVKGQFKKAVAKELLKLRAAEESTRKKKTVTVAQLRERESARLKIHPTLRRVVGGFKRKLEAKVALKQGRRRSRLFRQAKNFGKPIPKKPKQKQAKAQPAAQ